MFRKGVRIWTESLRSVKVVKVWLIQGRGL